MYHLGTQQQSATTQRATKQSDSVYDVSELTKWPLVQLAKVETYETDSKFGYNRLEK